MSNAEDAIHAVDLVLSVHHSSLEETRNCRDSAESTERSNRPKLLTLDRLCCHGRAIPDNVHAV